MDRFLTHEHSAPRPTGLRKITIPQIQAEAAGGRDFPSTSPGRVLAVFKRAAPALGTSRRVVDLIDTLMSHSRPQDWEGGPGPLVWPSDVELEDRLCVGPSQRKTLVRGALDAGLIRMRRSATGKRWGHRKGSGRDAPIVEAYGFDLSPLGERMAEFERLTTEWEARRAEGKRLRREITISRNDILALVDLAETQGLTGDDWRAAAAAADELWRERGSERDPLPLVPIAARLRALAVVTQEQVTAAVAAAVDSVKTDPAGPENRPRLTTTNQLLTAEAGTKGGEVGPERPVAREAASSTGRLDQRTAAQAVRIGPVQESAAQASALRGFVVTPMFLMQLAPTFRDWVTAPPRRAGWGDIYQAADFVRSGLGISLHAWGQACVVLGRQEAVTALAAIAARHATGAVRSPGGLLRKMVELHAKGTLRLDRTLFGLEAKMIR